MPRATPAMNDDIASSFGFPAVGRKKITAAFDGGRLTSDGGVLLLAQAERAMGICQRLAACIADPRDPARVIHRLDDILRSEEHTSELQSLMRISYAVFCLKKKNKNDRTQITDMILLTVITLIYNDTN